VRSELPLGAISSVTLAWITPGQVYNPKVR
jgi:hypothetical protein